jgi:hypothetical protein
MDIERVGNTIYELDPDGVNRWSFNIQAGYGLDKIVQPQSVIDKVATLMENAENLRVALTAAMDFIEKFSEDVESYTKNQSLEQCKFDRLNLEELLNKLK